MQALNDGIGIFKSGNYGARELITESNDSNSGIDVLGSLDALTYCSDNFGRLGPPPGRADDHRGDRQQFAAYRATCPAFEAAAAVIDKGLTNETPPVLAVGQGLVSEALSAYCKREGISRHACDRAWRR